MLQVFRVMDAARMVGENNIARCFGGAAFTIIVDAISFQFHLALHDDDIACCCHDAGFGSAGNGIGGEGHIFFDCASAGIAA